MENNFTEWLFNELQKREWSQSDLSVKSGVSQGAISKVVNGQRKPGVEFCEGIAKAFNIPPESVYRLAGFLPPQKTTQKNEELEFLFNQLSPGQQEMYMDLLRIQVEHKGAVSKKKTALSV